MYPETDIPPVQISQDYVDKICSHLPELPEQKLERLQKEYKLNDKLAAQVLNSEYSELFENIVRQSKVAPTTLAAFMTETVKALKRDGVAVEKVSDKQVDNIFKLVGDGKLAKEAMSEVFTWLSKNEEKTIEEAIRDLGLQAIPQAELEKLVTKIVEEHKELIKKQGESSFGVLMGIAMNNLRGKADAAIVSKVLKEKLKKALQ
jgi:glutamyl-tRNA(Gln) amidotransferase subunit E